MHVHYYTRSDRKEKNTTNNNIINNNIINNNNTTCIVKLYRYHNTVIIIIGIVIVVVVIGNAIVSFLSLCSCDLGRNKKNTTLFEFESLSSISSTLLLSSSLPRHLNSSNLSSQMIANTYWRICTQLLKPLLRDKCVIRILILFAFL